MIRDKNTDTDWEAFFDDDHVKRVWAVIEKNLPKYFATYADGPAAPGLKLFGGVATLKSGRSSKSKAHLEQRVAQAIEAYGSEAEKYREFLDPAGLDEYEEDPRQFGRDVERDLPIIRKLVHSNRPELAVWQTKFRRVRAKKADELLRVFGNQTRYAIKMSKGVDPVARGKLDDIKSLDFADFDQGAEDEKVAHIEGHSRNEDGLIKYGMYHISGVIGLGIISTVLWYHAPGHLPQRGRQSLAALYFLSDKDDFGLPSRSSEFLMCTANEYGCKIEHNFFYPYSLFTLYSLRIARIMEDGFKERGVYFDPSYRFVLTEDFLTSVAEQHEDEIKDWVDRDDY